ncbi:MAG: hypothetical protein ACT443_04665 [Gemmatimonadota bacterium]
MADKPDVPKPERERKPVQDELLQSIVKPKCDLCGSFMLERHCRMMCPMCGYQRDCSDP